MMISKLSRCFPVALCYHQFCVECVKKHIEVRLLEGTIPRCPHYQCESKLTLRSCASLLTPKVRALWARMIQDESIPVTDRVYCPNLRCSALMSRTEISKSTEQDGSMRCCFKCGKPFCISCIVSWHSNLSWDDYKRLGPYPTTNDMLLKVLANQEKWRQCRKCKHMIELSEGCSKVTCRCGNTFCYTCGAEWKKGGRGCTHQPKLNMEARIFICLIYIVCAIILVILTRNREI
ncbi:unnamed protein product [Thlaspi arvense]|uniref:RBR-type E3 ubiquitin transferase n=1 Tax=Thlaspi arvense TaxID=13288 RepID=A0AAU9RV29_THLAR|nr:unnamed protein product [Thlaspi arvense]